MIKHITQSQEQRDINGDVVKQSYKYTKYFLGVKIKEVVNRVNSDKLMNNKTGF